MKNIFYILILSVSCSSAQVPIPFGTGKAVYGAFATWSPFRKSPGMALQSGNLLAGSSNSGQGVLSTVGISSTSTNPIVYAEFYVKRKSLPMTLGVANPSYNTNPGVGHGGDNNSYCYYATNVSGAFQYTHNTPISITPNYVTGDTVSMVLDMTNKKVFFWQNGNVTSIVPLFKSADGIGTTGNTTLYAYFGDNGGGGDTVIANFGQSAFRYYSALLIGGVTLPTYGVFMGFK